MATSTLKTRIKHKTGTAAEWQTAATNSQFKPLEGELIVYESATTPMLKVGDGTSLVTALPFVGGNPIVSITRSGLTFTATHVDGTTSAFSQQDNNTIYTHPSHTAKSSGLYKITVDNQGHVSAATAVTKADITGLGIPGSASSVTLNGTSTTSASFYAPTSAGTAGQVLKSNGSGAPTWAAEYSYTLPTATSSVLGGVKVGSNITVSSGTISLTKTNVTTALGYTPPTTDTTYSAATQSAAGLMSANDKKKLDGIATNANNYTYTLPNATSSTLGGVKVGSNITVSSGTISLTKANVTAALGYTPPTSDTNTTYSAGTGISLSGTTFSNSGVRSIITGSSNGTISVNTNGTSADIAVKGLGSAAYKNASGTWGINITGSSASCTGNAATATTLSSTLAVNKGGTSATTKHQAFHNLVFQGAVTNANTCMKRGLYTYVTTATNTPESASYGGIETIICNDIAEGAAVGGSSSSSWVWQWGYCTNRVNPYIRNSINAGAFSAWRKVWLEGDLITGAVWNDYAEYRSQNETIEPGYITYCDDDGKLKKTVERLQKYEGVVSDTFGFAIGETDDCKTPLAVSGRALVYCDPEEEHFHSGDCVCAGPNGLAYRMTREEIIEFPDRIVGVVSEIPTYETWGTGNVEVNGRIWIKVK